MDLLDSVINKAEKPLILFETEGTYPYAGGGVSTWAHTLSKELENEVDYILLALTGSPNVESRYKMGKNIKDIIHIPLWGTVEPAEYYDPKSSWSHHLQKKYATSFKRVEELFFPIFDDFLNHLFDPFRSSREAAEIFYGLWRYFQKYDFKMTVTHPLIWERFKERLTKYYAPYLKNKKVVKPYIFDMVFGFRWLYHFLLPLAVPLPLADLTHATLAGYAALPSIAAKFEYGTPLMVTDHGVFIRERLIAVSTSNFSYFAKRILIDLATLVSRTVYAMADLISPVAGYNKRWETKFEADENRIEVIYNGIDPKLFVPQPKPPERQGRPTVVAAARVFPLKDVATMIRSCNVVRETIPDVHYIVYGSLNADKDYVAQCKQLIAELKLENNFVFGGFHDDPPNIYNEGDISILSSISEGFPYTVIESMSCARPVVATDVGGVREALEGCGIICKPRDPKALGEGVIKLLQNNDLRVELGKKAREKVLLNFTTEVSVDNYLKAYKKLSSQEKVPLKNSLSVESVVKLVQELDEEY